MKTRMLLSGLLKLRNIGILAILLFLAYAIDIPGIPYAGIVKPAAGIAVYLGFVLQTLSSKEFQEEFNRKEKIRKIQDLNYTCLRLASEAKKHTNAKYFEKLRKVMSDKDEIVNSFFRGEQSFLKEKIVEQTMNLVVSYIKLLTNFCIRSREMSSVDISVITDRINANTRKLSFARDPQVCSDLRSAIEMDEKLINRLKDERNELDRISAKLDYMETTVNLFKHQILSSIESEDMLEKLETAVNEAVALDNVLEERRKNRIRI